MASAATTYGFESTALGVVEGLNYEGKTVVVTGTSAGLGTETAKAFLSIGATVVGVVRNVEKMAPIAESLKAETGSDKLDILQCDLASCDSIRAFAAAFREKYTKIDAFICNAGVMATNGRRETAEGFEFQFGVCHLGHFLMVGLVVDLMLDVEGGSRLVTLSSVGHKLGGIRFDDMAYTSEEYNTWAAYGQAKTANILFAKEFNKRYASRGAVGFAVHPGGIQTELAREIQQEMMGQFLQMIEAKPENFGKGFKTIPQGAATTMFAATRARVEDGGSYCQDCQIVTEQWNGEMGYDKFQAAEIAEYATNEENMARLWQVSETLVNVQYPPGAASA